MGDTTASEPVRANSLEELVSCASKLERELGHVWYRGQPTTALDLIPPAFRVESDGRTHDEYQLICAFQVTAPSRYTSCPSPTDAASWLFLAQHFGLPTRLLDWTRSILVAAYFAVGNRENAGQGPADIFVLDPEALNSAELPEHESRRAPDRQSVQVLRNSRGVLLPWFDDCRPVFQAAFNEVRGIKVGPDAIRERRILAVHPTETDPRILVQQSRFTVHGRANPLLGHSHSAQFLRRIEVPDDSRRDIARQLDAVGISLASLFPDLDHLTEDLRARI